MRTTRRLSAALAALSIPLLAGGAFAVADSVSTRPGPQVILPSRTAAVTPTSPRSAHRAEPDANHDANEANDADNHDANDHQVGTTPTTVDDRHDQAGSDDPAGHEADDDRDATTPTTLEDRHDDVTTTTTARGDDGSGHDANDDGRDAGSGRDSGSGDSGSGDSGSDG
jgi:hypothetical protein